MIFNSFVDIPSTPLLVFVLKCLIISVMVYTSTLSKLKILLNALYIQTLPLLSNTDFHTHNTRHSGNLFVHRYYHSFAKNCLRYDLPETINTLPTTIRDKLYTHSRQGLVRYAKKFYLQSYNEICSISNCYICANQ